MTEKNVTEREPRRSVARGRHQSDIADTKVGKREEIYAGYSALFT